MTCRFTSIQHQDEDGGEDEAGDAIKAPEKEHQESASTAWKPWPSRQVVPINDEPRMQPYSSKMANMGKQGSPGDKQASQQGSPQRVAMAPGGGAIGKFFDEVSADLSAGET